MGFSNPSVFSHSFRYFTRIFPWFSWMFTLFSNIFPWFSYIFGKFFPHVPICFIFSHGQWPFRERIDLRFHIQSLCKGSIAKFQGIYTPNMAWNMVPGTSILGSWNSHWSRSKLVYPLNFGYRLVNVYIAMENHNFSWVKWCKVVPQFVNAKLVQISPISLWFYGTDYQKVTGVYQRSHKVLPHS